MFGKKKKPEKDKECDCNICKGPIKCDTCQQDGEHGHKKYTIHPDRKVSWEWRPEHQGSIEKE
jgi:hypothetical protein